MEQQVRMVHAIKRDEPVEDEFEDRVGLFAVGQRRNTFVVGKRPERFGQQPSDLRPAADTAEVVAEPVEIVGEGRMAATAGKVEVSEDLLDQPGGQVGVAGGRTKSGHGWRAERAGHGLIDQDAFDYSDLPDIA